MEMCPKCKKVYLMYDPQINKAICINTPDECNYSEEIGYLDYLDKYAYIVRPKKRESSISSLELKVDTSPIK